MQWLAGLGLAVGLGVAACGSRTGLDVKQDHSSTTDDCAACMATQGFACSSPGESCDICVECGPVGHAATVHVPCVCTNGAWSCGPFCQ